jgi:hypothetical protein
MKKTALLLLLTLLAFAGYSKSSDYYVDDQAVEAKLFSADQVTVDFSELSLASVNGLASIQEEKNAWVAVILDFFLGGIAVHRVYLGGKPILMLTYFITCGGIFGIVPLVDFFVLIINNEDITPYVGNDKFFMWGGN